MIGKNRNEFFCLIKELPFLFLKPNSAIGELPRRESRNTMDQFDDSMKNQISALLRAISVTRCFKEDKVPCQIEEGLFLGSVGAANNKDELKSKNITHVLTVASSLNPPYPNDFVYKVIAVLDREDTDLRQHFEECVNFIDEANRQGGGVLVHCFAGISRSVTIILAYLMKKRGMRLPQALHHVRTKRPQASPNPGFILQLQDFEKSLKGTANSGWKFTGAREALSIGLTTFADPKPLRKLTFADLLEATNGFHNDSLIGSGGFGNVYKAQLKDGSTVAIKKLIQISGQGDREFTAEMETIGKIKHRNLVPLLGYCKVGEERLLVYEYMKHGSLEDVLHNGKKDGIRLNWAARRKIAIGAARGLTFLHTIVPHIIHRDMKSSNVLLDENLEARVSDFGMARYMNVVGTHLSVSTFAGTPGYVPPEYYQTLRCSVKGDVYSYGVVLLELLTGKRQTDSADFGDNNLVGWVKQHAKLKISNVFDPVLLKEDASLEIELLEHLQVAVACFDDRAWKRPTMIQVMARFKEIQSGSGLAIDDLDGRLRRRGLSWS